MIGVVAGMCVLLCTLQPVFNTSVSRLIPSTQDILQWLLTMTTKVGGIDNIFQRPSLLYTLQVVCESRWGNSAGAAFEYTLVATFLATFSLRDIREALIWMQNQAAQDDQL